MKLAVEGRGNRRSQRSLQVISEWEARRLGLVALMVLWFFFVIAPKRIEAGPSGSRAVLCHYLYRDRRVEMRSLRELERLRLMTFNLENFRFERLQDGQVSAKLRVLGEHMLRERPDIIVLQEVLDRSSLEAFNHWVLENRYRVEFIEGIPGNTHHLAFLIKRNRKVHYEIRSHLREKWVDPISGKEEYLFWRDLPALMIKEQASDPSPSLVLFGVHGKAMKAREGDPKSVHLRAEQAKRMAQVVEQMWKQFGRSVPTIITGDFNSELNRDPILRPLWKVFRNGFDLSPTTKAPEDRQTHVWQKEQGEVGSELDGFMLSRHLRDHVLSIRVRHHEDIFSSDSTSQQMKISLSDPPGQRPSDHRPVILDLSLRFLE